MRELVRSAQPDRRRMPEGCSPAKGCRPRPTARHPQSPPRREARSTASSPRLDELRGRVHMIGSRDFQAGGRAAAPASSDPWHRRTNVTGPSKPIEFGGDDRAVLATIQSERKLQPAVGQRNEGICRRGAGRMDAGLRVTTGQIARQSVPVEKPGRDRLWYRRSRPASASCRCVSTSRADRGCRPRSCMQRHVAPIGIEKELDLLTRARGRAGSART